MSIDYMQEIKGLDPVSKKKLHALLQVQNDRIEKILRTKFSPDVRSRLEELIAIANQLWGNINESTSSNLRVKPMNGLFFTATSPDNVPSRNELLVKIESLEKDILTLEGEMNKRLEAADIHKRQDNSETQSDAPRPSRSS